MVVFIIRSIIAKIFYTCDLEDKLLKRIVLFIFLMTLSFNVYAQETDLTYDDGTPGGTVQSLDVGDVEVVRFTPEHPAILKSLSIYFGSIGAATTIYIWGDNGGNGPDLEKVIWSGSLTPVVEGWSEIDLTSANLDIDPPIHFYIGQIVEDASTLFSWDSSGSSETRSLIRDEGEWYYVGDGEETPQSVDALVRAVVEYHDIPQTYWFTDITESAGLGSPSRMAWGDYNNDGYDDLLVNGNTLYKNNGDNTFANVSEEAGIAGQSTNGGIWADYDNDGFLDFYATCNNYLPPCSADKPCAADGYSCVDGRCKSDSNTEERAHDILYRNNGDGTFSDVSQEAGAPYDFLPTEGAAWADINADGFVDLFVANYETPVSWTSEERANGNKDFLWVNMGDGTFVDKSETLGVRNPIPLCGRGVNFADFNDDGAMDLYVSNYRLDPNLMYENQGNGRFVNIANENGTQGVQISGAYGHTIGSSWLDINNDGYWDLLTGNLAHPRYIDFSDKTMLYINSGPPNFDFDDIREEAGITYSETHSDTAGADFNNDGFMDFFITDVYVGYQSFLYQNKGNSTFDDVTYPSGIRIDNGWGCAWADIDNDGDLDFISRKLYLNNTPSGNWLKIKLVGTISNAAAIGAMVRVKSGENTFMRQIEGGKGTTTQNSLTLHFGIGDATMVDSLTIRWPIYPPYEETYDNIKANSTITYVEREGELTDGGVDSEDDGVDETTAQEDGCSCHSGNSSKTPFIWPILFGVLLVTIRKFRFFHREL
jgi:ASPIC and UnbV/FG-GAP-like repeat